MSDDRYLDGDPDEPSVAMMDFTPFVSHTQQFMQMVIDLLEADRPTEAALLAIDVKCRAESILQDTETPKPRRVDVKRTADVTRPQTWKFVDEP